MPSRPTQLHNFSFYVRVDIFNKQVILYTKRHKMNKICEKVQEIHEFLPYTDWVYNQVNYLKLGTARMAQWLAFQPGNLKVDECNPDIGQTFSYCPWVAGMNGSTIKYCSLGTNNKYCSLQPRGNMKIRMNSKGTLCRPAGHKSKIIK